MPISKSANKSLRVAKRQAAENKSIKIRLKNSLKRSTATTLSQTFSMLDKAAKKNVIHKNKAARLKSRLAKRLSQEGAQAPSVSTKPTKTKATARKSTKKNG